MADQGVTVFVTTHYLEEAEHCRRLALIHAGRLIAAGGVRELKEVFAGRAVLEVLAPRAAEALEVLEREEGILETSVFGTRIHAVVRDAEEGSRIVRERLAAHGHAPVEVTRILPSLEDVFIHHVDAFEAARAGAGNA
jgi:ABC-2 type transport system ATP-binding protein